MSLWSWFFGPITYYDTVFVVAKNGVRIKRVKRTLTWTQRWQAWTMTRAMKVAYQAYLTRILWDPTT